MNVVTGTTWSQFANSNVVLFVWNIYQNEYPNHIANIAKAMEVVGARLHIISSTFRTQPYRRQFEEIAFLKRLSEEYGVETTDVSPSWIQGKYEKAIGPFPRIEETRKIDDELYYSILSSWLSRNKATLVSRDLSKRDQKLLREEVEEYFFWRESTQLILKEASYDFVIIFNGRHHSNVAVKQVVTGKNLKLFYLESGIPKESRIFLEPFQTHDILAMNCMFDNLLASKTNEELALAKQWARMWCQRNREDKSVNPFIRDDNRTPKGNLEEKSNKLITIPIFNSSLDERISNLGIPLHGWRSQNHAIIKMAEKLREYSFCPLVRIHPNTGWKSWSELLELLQMLKTSDVRFVLPWEAVSSYSLVEKAPFVVTWGSTIALEATAMGVPTVNLGRSAFDLLFDVTLISERDLECWNPKQISKPDRDKSLLAIYAVNNYGTVSEKIEWVQSLKISYKGLKHKTRKIQIVMLNAFSIFAGDLNARPYDIFFLLKRLTGESIAQHLMSRIANFLLNRKYSSSNKTQFFRG